MNCWYCGIELTLKNGYANSLTKDHQMPTTRGGLDAHENLVAACRRCNSRKGNRTVEEYRDYLYSLDGGGLVIKLAMAIYHEQSIKLPPTRAAEILALCSWASQAYPPPRFFGEPATERFEQYSFDEETGLVTEPATA